MKHPARPVRRIALAVASGLLALGLTACGGDDEADTTSDGASDQRSRHALEQVVKANEASLVTQKEVLEAMYSDVAVRAEGDRTLVFTYVLAEEMPAEAREAFQSEENPMAAQVRSQVLPQLEKAGVNDPQVHVTVSNPDGTEVYDETIGAEE